MQPNSNTKWYIIIVVLAALLVLSVTWNFLSGAKKPDTKSGSTNLPENVNASLFDSQSAVINGKITKIDGKILTVENNRGISGQVTAGDNMMVVDPSTAVPASPSADLNKIELNKNVMISLMVKDGNYIAQSINYIMPVPSFDPSKLPPVPSMPPIMQPVPSSAPSTKPAELPSPPAASPER